MNAIDGHRDAAEHRGRADNSAAGGKRNPLHPLQRLPRQDHLEAICRGKIIQPRLSGYHREIVLVGNLLQRQKVEIQPGKKPAHGPGACLESPVDIVGRQAHHGTTQGSILPGSGPQRQQQEDKQKNWMDETAHLDALEVEFQTHYREYHEYRRHPVIRWRRAQMPYLSRNSRTSSEVICSASCLSSSRMPGLTRRSWLIKSFLSGKLTLEFR